MLRKIFGGSTGRPPPRSVPAPELERALAHLAVEPPNATWVALVRTGGLLAGCFPSQPAGDGDRIAAMSGAMHSLGERISKELHSGGLRYGLIAGTDGLNLIVVLDQDYLLALGLPPAVSIDAAFDGLRLSMIPLLQLLGIADLPV